MDIDNKGTLPTSTQGAVSRSMPAEVYRGKSSNPYILINNQYFRQCFRDMYVRGCTCDSQCGRFQGCILGQLEGSWWNSDE